MGTCGICMKAVVGMEEGSMCSQCYSNYRAMKHKKELDQMRNWQARSVRRRYQPLPEYLAKLGYR